ncbi:enolase N-terminal-like fold-containing protein, partial [Intestinibacter sp.]|uniref:enolase N-terminal-like fold-containing protein n=1 Tax=Intestinibacter sp. TaxID=1965304 RepID=UPI003F14A772
MWELYDNLIENIQEDIKINDLVIGTEFAMVISDSGAGISRVLNDKRFPFENEIKPNMKLKDLAKSIKSWNFVEASLGLAAINAFYNKKQPQSDFKLEKIKHPFVSTIDPDDRVAVVDAVLENKENIQKSYDAD